MTCQQFRYWLNEWIAGLLTSSISEDMRAHERDCQECREEAEIAREYN